jgi:hypothetical protein
LPDNVRALRNHDAMIQDVKDMIAKK